MGEVDCWSPAVVIFISVPIDRVSPPPSVKMEYEAPLFLSVCMRASPSMRQYE